MSRLLNVRHRTGIGCRGDQGKSNRSLLFLVKVASGSLAVTLAARAAFGLHSSAAPRGLGTAYLAGRTNPQSTTFFNDALRLSGRRQHPARAENPGGPPLPPTDMGVPLVPSKPGAPLKIELFLDLCCPFSKKMFQAVAGTVAAANVDKATFILHQVAQPWHPQSSYMHEAAMAVLELAGSEKYVEYIGIVFDNQAKFFDDQVWDKSRSQIYTDLVDLAKPLGCVHPDAMLSLLKTGEGNGGNSITQRLKWATKLHRVRGVHVTPTVFLNGLEAGVISSGWSSEQWQNFVDYYAEAGDR